MNTLADFAEYNRQRTYYEDRVRWFCEAVHARVTSPLPLWLQNSIVRNR